jgi:hypothetical protein
VSTNSGEAQGHLTLLGCSKIGLQLVGTWQAKLSYAAVGRGLAYSQSSIIALKGQLTTLGFDGALDLNKV